MLLRTDTEVELSLDAVSALGARRAGGLVDVIHQGSRIRGSADQRLHRVFGALPQFRAASFVPPVDDEVSLEVRADLAERLGQLIGTRPPVATDQLATLVRSTFAPDMQIASRVSAGIRGLGLKVPEPVTRASQVLERFDDASDPEVVTTTAQSWVDLTAGREALVALDTVVQQDLETLRSAQSAASAGDEGLAADLVTERLELVDLLAAEELPANIARIRAITERLVAARLSAIESANAELKEKVGEKTRQIRVQYTDVTDAVLDEALRPLEDLAPVIIVDLEPVQQAPEAGHIGHHRRWSANPGPKAIRRHRADRKAAGPRNPGCHSPSSIVRGPRWTPSATGSRPSATRRVC